MAKKPFGVVLYGFWGISVGLFYITLPLFVYHFINTTFYLEKSIIAFLWGGLYILVSILVMTKFKFGKMKQNDKKIFFLFINIVTIYLALQVILHYSWQRTIIDLFMYIFIVTFIIIPAASIIYFNIPSISNYFKTLSK